MFPYLDTLDNMYFSSDGHVGVGGLDVFRATKFTETNDWTVMNVGLPVNSPKDDFAFILSEDMKTGYFSSNRKDGKGQDDIYAFTILKPFVKQLFLKGLIANEKTNERIIGAKVDLLDNIGNIVMTTTSNEKGEYEFAIEEDKDYTVKANKKDFFETSSLLTTKDLSPDVTDITRNLDLKKDPGLGLYCYITDQLTGAPLKDVSVKVVDLATGKTVMKFITPVTGDGLEPLLTNNVGDCLKYQVVLAREGYLGKTLPYNHCIKKPGIISLHETLDMRMSKIEVGMDLAKIIDIKPIYFDVNKYNIRSDAQIELQKIVNVMNENPTMEIELGSHTDCRASAAYNEKLSDKRAKSSAEWVRQRITNPARIYGKGYGEAKLVNDCGCEGAVKSDCSDEEHQANRRTEFIIIRM